MALIHSHEKKEGREANRLTYQVELISRSGSESRRVQLYEK